MTSASEMKELESASDEVSVATPSCHLTPRRGSHLPPGLSGLLLPGWQGECAWWRTARSSDDGAF